MSTSKINILGYSICSLAIPELLIEIDSKFKINEAVSIFCLNPHSYSVSLEDKEFGVALNNATFLIPDGVGISLASKILNPSEYMKKLPGPDFFDYFCSYEPFRNKKLNHFFLGSNKKTLEKLVQNVTNKYGINVCGTYSPPYVEEIDNETNRNIINIINNAKTDILWVGMTAPKQEKWICKNFRSLNVKMSAGVGAVFDFQAGNIKRAPKFLITIGLEGYYRLLKEPRRLASRAFVTDLIFVGHVLKEYFLRRFVK